MNERCFSCGGRTQSGRREFHLRDSTDATISSYEGVLCRGCWEDVVGEIIGFGVGKQGARRC